MIGVAVPLRLKRGTCCSTDHSSLPLRGSKACRRPSTERRTTAFSPIAASDSSSEFTCDRHSWRPVAPSRATMSPLLLPTTTIPRAADGPADSGILSFLTQAWRPVPSDTANSSPLCEAANTNPLSIAGPSPKRSTNCFLPPPTPSPQIFFTGNVAGNLTSTAGGSTSLSLLQPAAISRAARLNGSNRRIRDYPCWECLRKRCSQPASGRRPDPGFSIPAMSC